MPEDQELELKSQAAENTPYEELELPIRSTSVPPNMKVSEYLAFHTRGTPERSQSAPPTENWHAIEFLELHVQQCFMSAIEALF